MIQDYIVIPKNKSTWNEEAIVSNLYTSINSYDEAKEFARGFARQYNTTFVVLKVSSLHTCIVEDEIL